MKTIAVTGGIASGKSLAASYLKSKGYELIDADEIARVITAPGGRAIPFIMEHFGADYTDDEGGLDRAAMRELVFNNPDKKALLEMGTTDIVIEEIEKIKREREEAGNELLFFDIPLLFEKNQEDKYDYILMITADRETRKERILQREGLNDEMAELIIASQFDENKKVEAADFVIYNNGEIADLYRSMDEVLLQLGRK
ncbi:MAG: dephospho-CoA kinase [Mogibacterium sp.]|nr:dephospho-CoA kinase [Mogibacterium sp.]